MQLKYIKTYVEKFVRFRRSVGKVKEVGECNGKKQYGFLRKM